VNRPALTRSDVLLRIWRSLTVLLVALTMGLAWAHFLALTLVTFVE